MKRILLLLILLFASLQTCLHAQAETTPRRWLFNFSIGTSNTRRLTQPILPHVYYRHRDDGCFSTGVSVRYFWSKHWGIQWMNNMGQTGYSYYRDTRTSEIKGNSRGYFMNISSGFAYRREFKRFTLQPNFSIGLEGLNERDNTSFYLKHPDSNDTDRYNLSRNGNIGFIVNPSIYIGWKLTRRIYAFMEITYQFSLYGTPPISASISDAFTGEGIREVSIRGKRLNRTLVKFGVTLAR
ncbi:MAG: hypothetical protein LBL97_01710 [Prevotellaceae bacterium]|jgi:hypothetical protein|nr:hypothetical protein [Prevotellaceae bacterium]